MKFGLFGISHGDATTETSIYGIKRLFRVFFPHSKVPLVAAPIIPPKNRPINKITPQVIPGGMMKLKYMLSKAAGATALPIMPAIFSNAPDAPSRVSLAQTVAMPTMPSNTPATYGDHSSLRM